MRDRAGDLDAARRVRVGAVQDPRARLVRDHLDERGDVHGRGRVVDACAAVREDHAGRRSSTRLTNIHSRGLAAPRPWIFDGRRIETGSPLSSMTCSAATLFAP